MLSVGAEATSEVAEAGATMLFETFVGSELVTQKQSGKLRAMFGPFPASLATKVCSLVNRMADWLPEEVVDNLTKPTTIKHTEPVFEFGRNIKFVVDEPCAVDFDDEKYNWLDSDEDETQDAGANFDMRYTEDRSVGAKSSMADKEKVNAGWLKHQVELYFGGEDKVPGMSTGEVCATIFDMLSSNRSDTELQNEVCSDVHIHVTDKQKQKQELVNYCYIVMNECKLMNHLNKFDI